MQNPMAYNPNVQGGGDGGGTGGPTVGAGGAGDMTGGANPEQSSQGFDDVMPFGGDTTVISGVLGGAMFGSVNIDGALKRAMSHGGGLFGSIFGKMNRESIIKAVKMHSLDPQTVALAAKISPKVGIAASLMQEQGMAH